MKKILALVLGITLASSIAMAKDTTTIWITKAGENTAKVCSNEPLGYDHSKCLGTAPIKFADDSTWATVKHSYDVSPATADALASKNACITVHGDGGISVSTAACTKKKASSKTAATK